MIALFTNIKEFFKAYQHTIAAISAAAPRPL
jgi:hypothetical protein